MKLVHLLNAETQEFEWINVNSIGRFWASKNRSEAAGGQSNTIIEFRHSGAFEVEYEINPYELSAQL
ncbi:hypothetical protein SEA_HUNTINGDON_50 [Arthrobacter phage Huntingdon]|uniref:Uncharacterized protein n=1 Tax=Arthrobacter phage Huntingdon TaxID=2047760 RepID=A0A2H4PAK7_9CAUD|nr:hypothetical protein KDJ00_gp50 [Arthrobacter phage Huntingdon]AOQ28262.1 hypothetical protein SEA_RCIGASTRUGA_50 [Arthrobacter phage RcigaStruga]ATW59257.1 hypothetical protein SEA_HUNTINGDON_50 [Arthrobacter phage Huntingdon]